MADMLTELERHRHHRQPLPLPGPWPDPPTFVYSHRWLAIVMAHAWGRRYRVRYVVRQAPDLPPMMGRKCTPWRIAPTTAMPPSRVGVEPCS